MRKFKLFVLVFILSAAAGCSTIDISYIGETLKPTKNIEFFFRGQNINRPYDIIGKVIVKAPDTFSGKEIQKKLIETAREKGANAVLINLYTQIPRGSSSFNNYPYYGYGPGYDCGPYWEDGYWGGGGSVQYYYEALIKAEFLLYKTQTTESAASNNIQYTQVNKIGGQNEKTE